MYLHHQRSESIDFWLKVGTFSDTMYFTDSVIGVDLNANRKETNARVTLL